MDKVIKILIFHGLIYSKDDVETILNSDVGVYVHKIKLINQDYIYMYSGASQYLIDYCLFNNNTKLSFTKEPLQSSCLKMIIESGYDGDYRGFIFTPSCAFMYGDLGESLIQLSKLVFNKDIFFIKYTNVNLLKIKRFFEHNYKIRFFEFFPGRYNEYIYEVNENINLRIKCRLSKRKQKALIIDFYDNYDFNFKITQKDIEEDVQFRGNLFNDDFDDFFNFVFKNQLNKYTKMNSKIKSDITGEKFNKDIALILDRMNKFHIGTILKDNDFYNLSCTIDNYILEINKIPIDIDALKFNIDNSNVEFCLKELMIDNLNNLEKVYQNFKSEYNIVREYFLKQSNSFSMLK